MSNSNDERIYKNLIILLKLFQSRPYHLAKYLMENEALTEQFIEKVRNSERLNKMEDGEETSIKAIYFIDISHMKNFFNSLTDEAYDENQNNSRNLASELNRKLERCLKEERYEDAIRIRDYMQKNNIQRNKDI